MKKEKKVVVVLLISILAVLLSLFIISKRNSSNKLESLILDLSKEFYNDYYYKQLENVYEDEELKLFLSNYSESGIKVDLDAINKYNSKNRDFKLLTKKYTEINSKKYCNHTNTYVLFFPVEPYEKESYTTKTILDCEFLNEK